MEEKKERYLTPAQVAERYQLPLNWVYGCKDLKEMRVKIGKYNRYRESDLIAFEERRSENPRGFNVMRRKTERIQIKAAKEKRGKFKLMFDMA